MVFRALHILTIALLVPLTASASITFTDRLTPKGCNELKELINGEYPPLVKIQKAILEPYKAANRESVIKLRDGIRKNQEFAAYIDSENFDEDKTTDFLDTTLFPASLSENSPGPAFFAENCVRNKISIKEYRNLGQIELSCTANKKTIANLAILGPLRQYITNALGNLRQTVLVTKNDIRSCVKLSVGSSVLEVNATLESCAWMRLQKESVAPIDSNGDGITIEVIYKPGMRPAVSETYDKETFTKALLPYECRAGYSVKDDDDRTVREELVSKILRARFN